MITCYASPKERTSPSWCRAFAAGCGGHVIDYGPKRPGGVAMFGSPKLWGVLEQAQQEGCDWYYGDHGYFGRNRFYRCTRNAFMHTGVPGDATDLEPRRFQCFGIDIKPWRKKGSFILICPPSQSYGELRQFDAADWLSNTTYLLQQYTDRPIKVRFKVDAAMEPLEQALQDCWALVTYNSNAAVEAALMGVPVFPRADCAASLVGLNDLSKIEQPLYPDFRLEWACTLANNQWTLAEMMNGDLWRKIGR